MMAAEDAISRLVYIENMWKRDRGEQRYVNDKFKVD